MSKEIDFDSIKNKVLEKYSVTDNNPYKRLNAVNAKIAADVCIEILKEYHEQFSQDS